MGPWHRAGNSIVEGKVHRRPLNARAALSSTELQRPDGWGEVKDRNAPSVHRGVRTSRRRWMGGRRWGGGGGGGGKEGEGRGGRREGVTASVSRYSGDGS